MPKLVLIELGYLDPVLWGGHALSFKVNFDLTAAPTRPRVRKHMLVKFDDRIRHGFRPDVKQQGEVGFQELADSLEEPLVTVNLAVVAVLQPKHKVNPMGLERVILHTKVHGSQLEQMQEVGWMLAFRDIPIH